VLDVTHLAGQIFVMTHFVKIGEAVQSLTRGQQQQQQPER
jgi:hypothetical protein